VIGDAFGDVHHSMCGQITGCYIQLYIVKYWSIYEVSLANYEAGVSFIEMMQWVLAGLIIIMTA
jgi:hypothetical protein